MNDEYRVRYATTKKDGKVFIKIWTDNAEVVISYTDQKEVAIITQNLGKVLGKIMDELFIDNEFNDEIDNQLERWLKDG